MNVLFHTNCQAQGIIHFLRFSEDGHKVNTRTNLVYMIQLGLLDRVIIDENVEWADVVFYHHVEGLDDPVKPGSDIIPMSVYYNSGYYVSTAGDEHWAAVKNHGRRHGFRSSVKFAVESTEMGYRERYEKSRERMKEKEVNEGVPEEMRLSRIILEKDKVEQQSLTYNHPSSHVLFDMTNLVLRRLDLRVIDEGLRDELCRDLNVARLPCSDWICSGSREALGLSYGGTRADNAECEKFAAKKLREMSQ